MAIDTSTLWGLLQPAAESMVAANANAGLAASIPPHADVDVFASDDGSSFIVKIRGRSPATGVTALRIDAQYWDTDGHIVFLGGYTDRNGNVIEIELERLDMQPIDRLPTVADLRFEEPHTGYYKTTK